MARPIAVELILSKIAVIYISRRLNHPRFSRAFLDSIISRPAGAPYDLWYVLKGYSDNEDDPVLSELGAHLPCSVRRIRISDDQSPLKIFFTLGREVEYFLALNSWSRVLAANWLVSYQNALLRTDCGLVGATGSFEAVPGAKFPNVALRTNAFMMRGRLAAKIDITGINTRAGNLRLEAGKDNLTQQVYAQGFSVHVVDRFGEVHEPAAWPVSGTFRSGAQEGLLVADNRTAHYQYASSRRRLKLGRLAFGDEFMPGRVAGAERFRQWYNWYFPRGLPDVISLITEGGVAPR